MYNPLRVDAGKREGTWKDGGAANGSLVGSGPVVEHQVPGPEHAVAHAGLAGEHSRPNTAEVGRETSKGRFFVKPGAWPITRDPERVQEEEEKLNENEVT